MVAASKKETNVARKSTGSNKGDECQKLASQVSDDGDLTVVSLTSKFLDTVPPSLWMEHPDPEGVLVFRAERNKFSDLPTELIAFSNLQNVNVSYNTFSRFPVILCGLANLTELVMIGCELEYIPTEIEGLIFLETFILDLNKFFKIGDVLYDLNNLTTLSLGMNHFSVFNSSLPFQMRKLNLDSNHLVNFPEAILSLENLQYLNLNFNRIKELPPDIDCLQKLEHFTIVKNRLMALPSTICNLTNLRSLDLSNNNLEVLPGNMSNLENLQEINVTNNPIIQPPRHICDHGIDAIRAFQDCLKKQLYEPCNRALKVFILGNSRSGKKDLFNHLSGRGKEPPRKLESSMPDIRTRKKGSALSFAKCDVEGLTLTIFRCSGKKRYSLIHQLFFCNSSLFIICIQMDKYKNSHMKDNVIYWLQLVQAIVPSAMVLLLPTYQCKGSRSPFTKMQFEKSVTELRNSVLHSVKSDHDRIDQHSKALKWEKLELWNLEKSKHLKELQSAQCKVLTPLVENSKKYLTWKIGKNEKCGRDLLVYLKSLTHHEDYFAANLQDEVQSSWKTLEKLIVNYRKKKSGRLYLNRSDIVEPAIQIGVHCEQIDDVINYLNLYGIVCMFERVRHIRSCLFYDPQLLVAIFNSVLQNNLLELKDDPSLQQFSPFELQAAKEELTKHGVMNEDILLQLLKYAVPDMDSVDLNYLTALMRNLSIARKTDASNIKEVLRSRNSRSVVVTSPIFPKKTRSFFSKKKEDKPNLNSIGRSSSQSCDGMVTKRLKNTKKRVVSYSALPPEVFTVTEEKTNMSKNAHFIPWYITQEYRPQAPTVDTLVNDEKSKVMTLWPGRMRTSVHKLQVVAIFYNYQDVMSIFHRLSVALHHCVDYRDDWRARLSATIEGLPLLVEVTSVDNFQTISMSTRGELDLATSMWIVIFKVVENFLKLIVEYPGIHYDLLLVCPHCVRDLKPQDRIDDCHKFPLLQIMFSFKENELDVCLEDDEIFTDYSFDAEEKEPKIEDITCPFLNATEKLNYGLLYPPAMEFDHVFLRYFDEILPYLTRTNWRSFGKSLGLSGSHIDIIRDCVTESYDFGRQKELMLIFWHRLNLESATIAQLIEACQKEGFLFLANKLTSLQSKIRAPSLLMRPPLGSQSSFSANRGHSSTTDSASCISESCQSITESLT